MKKTPAKLCIDCRFFGGSAHSSNCMHPRTVSEVSPVTGEDYRDRVRALAHNQRMFPVWIAVIAGECGTSARWFEPKGGEA